MVLLLFFFTNRVRCPEQAVDSNSAILSFRLQSFGSPCLSTHPHISMPTELPYAADAEMSLTFDELEVCFKCSDHLSCC